MDLDRATINWMLNGKSALSGIGKKTFSFNVGEIGTATNVRIDVSGREGDVSKTVTISPGTVDLLWQATDSYTPPFYRGKALPAAGSTIRIIAMPNLISGGQPIKSSSLVYKWSRNFDSMENASGYGKDTYTFKNSYLDPEEEVVVNASSASGSASAEGKIIISIISPLVFFYENHPLLGIRYEKALYGELPLSTAEFRVTAEPYFFSAFNKTLSDLSYKWRLNGGDVPGSPDDLSSLVLRQDKNESGITKISLAVKSASKIMQAAGNSFSLSFKER